MYFVKFGLSTLPASDHPRLLKETIFLTANDAKDVNRIKEERLDLLDSRLLTLDAVFQQKTINRRQGPRFAPLLVPN